MTMRCLIATFLLASLTSDALAGQAAELTAQRVQDSLTTVDAIPENSHVRPLDTTFGAVDVHAVRTKVYGTYCEPDQIYYTCPIYELLRVRPWTK